MVILDRQTVVLTLKAVLVYHIELGKRKQSPYFIDRMKGYQEGKILVGSR